MLRDSDRRIGNRSIPLVKLRSRHPGDARPVRLRRIQIKTVVEIDTDPQSRFIDHEEAPKPPAEEGHHRRITVRELDRALPLRSFTRVKRDTSREERSIGQDADLLGPPLIHRVDFGQLGEVERVRRDECRPLAGLRFE